MSEKFKSMLKVLGVVFLMALVMIPAASAQSDKYVDNVDKQLEGYYNSRAFTEGRSLDSYVPHIVLDEPSEAEVNPDNGVTIRHIGIKTGEGDKDIVNVYSYIKDESGSYMAFYTGQCLTHTLSERMAIYLADRWDINVYVIERREFNVAREEDANSIMLTWNDKVALRDYAIGNAFVRIDGGIKNNIDPAKIRLTIVGHSLGATLATMFEASSYDKGLSACNYLTSVDTIIKYDPQDPRYEEFKQGQMYHCIDLMGRISSNEGAIQDMKGMLDIATAALDQPDEVCAVQPLEGLGIKILTNIQVFRLAAGETHQSMTWPYNDEYCYWGLDPITSFMSPLPNVDEQELLQAIVNGGAVNYSPNPLEYSMDALIAEKDSIDEDSFSGKDCTYIGIRGGFGPYGSYWYKSMGGKTIEWGEDNEGHGGIYMDKNAPELWDMIAATAISRNANSFGAEL